MADQHDKVQIVLEVVGGGRAQQEIVAIKSGLSSLGPSATQAGQGMSSGLGLFNADILKMKSQLAGLSQQVGSGSSGLGGQISGLTSGFATLGSDGSAALGLLAGPLGVAAAGATLAASAIGTLTAATVAAGVQSHDALATIEARTGSTGTALTRLGDNFLNVLGQVPQGADEVTDVLVKMNQRFGLTGESLEGISRRVLDLSRLTGSNALGGVVEVFSSWDVKGQDMARTLDMMFAATQRSGVEFNKLAGFIERNDAPLRALGFNFTQSLALVTELEKHGVNTDRVLSSMTRAVGNLAKSGLQPQDAFKRIVESIQNADEQHALLIARQAFGARAAEEFFDAIRSGQFSIDGMVASLNDSAGSLDQAAKKGLKVSDMFGLMKNSVDAVLAPLGVDLVGVMIGTVIPVFDIFLIKLKEGVDFWRRMIDLAGDAGKFGTGFALIKQFAGFGGKQEPTTEQLLGVRPGGPLLPDTLVPLAPRTVTPPRAGGGLTDEQLALLFGLKGKQTRRGLHEFNASFARQELGIWERGMSASRSFDKSWNERLNKTADRSLKQLQDEEKAATEIRKLESDIRIANAQTEAERIILMHQFEKDEFAKTEMAKTEIGRKQALLREEIFLAEQERRNRERLQELQIGNTILAAELGAFRPGATAAERLQSQIGLEQLKGGIEVQKASRAGFGPEVQAAIAAESNLRVIGLIQKRYEELWNNVSGSAGRIWDDITERGKSVWKAFADEIGNVWKQKMKELFQRTIADLLTPFFAGLEGLGTRGQGQTARRGLGGGLLNLGGLFGGGGGAPGGVFGGGSQGGGNFTLFGGGGGGLTAPAPLLTRGPFGDIGLSTGGGVVQGGPAGSTGAGGGFGGLGGFSQFGAIGKLGKFLSGGHSGALGTAGALTAGIGGGFLGGFGVGKLLGIGGKRSAIAGGVGAAAGGIATAFFGPLVGAAVGAGVGALTAGLLRIFGGKTRESKLRDEILRDFALSVQDGKILGTIKRIGEGAFGRDADRKRFETLRLDPVQGLLLNYAQQTGQSPVLLPLYQRFYGKGGLADNQRLNIAKFAQGGVVPGVDRGVDSVVSLLRPGETVVPKGQFVPAGRSPSFTIQLNVENHIDGSKSPAATADALVDKIRAVLPRLEREIAQTMERAMGKDFRRTQFRQSLFGM